MALAITTSAIGLKNGDAFIVAYDNLDEADTSPAALEYPDWYNQSVQVKGTFNGGTVIVQASNDGVTWATALDTAGAAVSFSAAGFKQIASPARFLRPLVSAGTGVDVDVFFMFRRH
jgi:hypothetical protein